MMCSTGSLAPCGAHDPRVSAGVAPAWYKQAFPSKEAMHEAASEATLELSATSWELASLGPFGVASSSPGVSPLDEQATKVATAVKHASFIAHDPRLAERTTQPGSACPMIASRMTLMFEANAFDRHFG